ncbi:hypothetical protein AAHH17_02335 [Lysinibacillus capsici]
MSFPINISNQYWEPIFIDPEGDTMSFTVTSSNPNITVVISNGWLQINAPQSADNEYTTITLTADDGHGNTVDMVFTAYVKYY